MEHTRLIATMQGSQETGFLKKTRFLIAFNRYPAESLPNRAAARFHGPSSSRYDATRRRTKPSIVDTSLPPFSSTWFYGHKKAQKATKMAP
jgi:hypothetical protein